MGSIQAGLFRFGPGAGAEAETRIVMLTACAHDDNSREVSGLCDQSRERVTIPSAMLCSVRRKSLTDKHFCPGSAREVV